MNVFTDLGVSEEDLLLEKQDSNPKMRTDTTMPRPRMKNDPCMSETETIAVALIPPRAELVHSFSGGQ